MLIAFILAAFLTTVSDLDAFEPDAVLRVLDPVLSQSLHDSYLVSPTIRSLVDELDRSDLIVHIIPMHPDNRAAFAGTLQFVVSAGGRRFLRITINDQLPPDRRAAILGHELQHALEVAHTASVTDARSFETFYQRIGEESAGKPNIECYETEGARRAGERVLLELREARIASSRR